MPLSRIFVLKANQMIKTKDNLVPTTPIEALPEGVGAGGSDYMEVSPKYPGARLEGYWRVWESFKVHPRVVLVLKQGYCLPFKEKPPLTRFPTSSYQKQLFSSTKAKSFVGGGSTNGSKKGSGSGSKQELSRILQLFQKPENKWRPVIDLSVVNTFLHVPKMETAEVIRASLQTGEWVASIDLTDTYFHIPIHQKFQKYLRFHV